MSKIGPNIDILILQGEKMLLGLLSDEWLYEGKKVYGVPGKDLLPGETFEECVKRNIRKEFLCECRDVKIIC